MTAATNTPPQEPATYWTGEHVVCECTFTLRSGALVDPTAVFFKYTPPGLTEVVLTYTGSGPLVRVSTGLYQVDLDTTGITTGRWRERWLSTGNGAGAIERYFEVKPSMQASP